MTFESNLCLVLAHTILFECREEFSPNGIVDDATLGGDPRAPNPQESTAQAMQAYVQYLPQLLQTMLPQLVPAAQAQLAATQATSPAMSKLQADMFSQLAPQLNKTSQEIDASNKLAGSQADLAVLTGPGAQSALASEGIDKLVNPEFYTTRSGTSGAIGNLLGGGLTPAESEAITRNVNQKNQEMGLGGTPTSTSTVANAMQYGNAARDRQLQGIGAATSFLPNSRGIDPTQVALGRPSINTGQSQFLGVNQQAGAGATDTANNFFNQIAGFQNTAMNVNANRRDSLDRVVQTAGDIGSNY